LNRLEKFKNVLPSMTKGKFVEIVLSLISNNFIDIIGRGILNVVNDRGRPCIVSISPYK